VREAKVIAVARKSPRPQCPLAGRGAEWARDEVICRFVGGGGDRKGPAVAIAALARAGEKSRRLMWLTGTGGRRRFARLGADILMYLAVFARGVRPFSEWIAVTTTTPSAITEGMSRFGCALAYTTSLERFGSGG
jgi:hypothetical protein